MDILRQILSESKVIFFDLDDTIWDFRKNGEAGLRQIYADHDLTGLGVPDVEQFLARYVKHNDDCWARYRRGELDQNTLRWLRYDLTLKEFGVENKTLAITLAADYLDAMSAQDILVEGARELLDLLHGKKPLHLITNGFEEVQHRKLRVSKLGHYFDSVTTSEQANAVKPDPRIFHTALAKAKSKPEQALYVGDSPEVDGSCKAVGMNFIWLNRHDHVSKQPHVEVSTLHQIRQAYPE